MPLTIHRRRWSLLLPIALGIAALSCLSAGEPCRAESGLISNVQAERAGLVRAWFSQAQLDRTRYRVERALLDSDQLFVLTTAGTIHAMDAETGRTLWVTRVGNPDYPSLGPTVNAEMVGVVNGSTVIILDRKDGREKMSRQLGGGPGGGPAMGEEYVYIPLFTGKLEAYSLLEPKASVWYYASAGRSFEAASATTDSITWPTDRGYLYVANNMAQGVRYRFEGSGQLNPHPSAAKGRLYASSTNGYVYALDELTGQQIWRYSAGPSVSRSPLLVAGRAFVSTEEPALHAISADTGEGLWQARGIDQLVGVSEKRAYGITPIGDLVVMDVMNGVPLGSVRTSTATHGVVNASTDRLYLVSETGLVQCLHEIGSDEPLRHTAGVPDADQPADQPGEQPANNLAEPADEANGAEEKPTVVNPFEVPEGENIFDGDDSADENIFDF